MSPFIKNIVATWLTTCIAGSVLLGIMLSNGSGTSSESSIVFTMAITVASFFLSLPAMLIYGWATWLLRNRDPLPRVIWQYLLSVILPYLTFLIILYFVSGRKTHDPISTSYVFVPYSIAFLISVFIFNKRRT